MEYAAERYGKVERIFLDSFDSKSVDGKYLLNGSVVKISSKCNDAFITGFHEYIHALDVENSYELELSKSDKGVESYNIFSSRVLSSARKQVGLSRASRRYDDALMQIFGMNTRLFSAYSNDHMEIIAYALEKAEFGKAPNKLTLAIARGFKNDQATSRLTRRGYTHLRDLEGKGHEARGA